MGDAATPSTTTFEVHSEAHGPHWIAWLTRAGTDKSERSIVLIGETKEEAEARARQWAQTSGHSF